MLENDKQNKISRGEFFKITSIATLSLSAVVAGIVKIYGIGKEKAEYSLLNDFHFFGNNLTNLHFYFINTKNTGKIIKADKTDLKSFMIVKIPQQHLTEQSITAPSSETYPENYFDTNLNARISGFSYLAFELFPESTNSKGVKTTKTSFTIKDDLLQWNNCKIFRLITPEPSNFINYAPSWNDFKDSPDYIKNDIDLTQEDFQARFSEFYKSLFKYDKEWYPITILELPRGLITTPYTDDAKIGDDKEKVVAFFGENDFKKQTFIYKKGGTTFTRTVEEIWNAQMFFQSNQSAVPTSPYLRAVAMYDRYKENPIITPNTKRLECPLPPPVTDLKFLPTFLDEKEILFLTNVGRPDAQDKSWSIETKGLTVTGLGAITKLHYKNFTPPNGTDLAEYEHHITLGRDEFIKVARIGVISATGQKALYIQIAERKIVNGTSFMELNEYVEIIQKEIKYYDENIFIANDPNKDKNEPYNYIQARKPKKESDLKQVLHTYDDIYDGNANADIENDVWIDRSLWDLLAHPNIPSTFKTEKWNTHYRRWPFKEIKSITFITPYINTQEDPNEPNQINQPQADGSQDCLNYFWPVKRKKTIGADNDCYLDFVGTDWNDKPIYFSSTFLFIRKTYIESINVGDSSNLISKLYTGFFGQKESRRRIYFTNKAIAYTPDYNIKENKTNENTEVKPSTPNKLNVAKTDYFEYYFSLCRENIEKSVAIATYNTTIKKVQSITNTAAKVSEIFNERYFPLYPQLMSVQLQVSNLQAYSSKPVLSLGEMNNDYVNYGFIGLKYFKNKDEIEVSQVYNKAKLIFNHTQDFIDGKNNVWEQVNGKWQEGQEGYTKIKTLFNNAGTTAGALVNTDFDIESIGLVQQGIALGKQFNEKYQKLENFENKVKKFNPIDIFRQAPELFNGISWLDILQNVFPEIQAPINQLKELTHKIDELKDDVFKNPIYTDIKEKFRIINEAINNANDQIQLINNEIKSKRADLENAVNNLAQTGFTEIEKYINNYIELAKTTFFTYEKGVVKFVQGKEDEIINYLTAELISKAELLYPYYKIVKDIVKLKDDLINIVTDQQCKDFINKNFAAVIENAKNNCYLINFSATDQKQILISKDVIETSIKSKIKLEKDSYLSYLKCLNAENQSLLTTFNNNFQNSINDKNFIILKAATNTALKTYEEEVQNIKSTIQKNYDNVNSFLTEFKNKFSIEYEKVKHLENDVVIMQQNLKALLNIVNEINFYNYIEKYKKQILDIETFAKKIEYNKVLTTVDDFIKDNSNGYAKIVTEIEEYRNSLITSYANNYSNINNFIDDAKTSIETYNKNITTEYFSNILNKIKVTNAIKTINDAVKIVNDAKNTIDGKLKELKKNQKEYEDQLNKYATEAGKDLIKQVEDALNSVQQKIQNTVDVNELEKYYEMYEKGKKLYNLLTNPMQKEISFVWQTTSLKNFESGIIDFGVSNNPATTLDLKNISTIYLKPNQFPSIVDRIEYTADNRLSNFSITVFKALIINFNEVSFKASNNQNPKFEVQVKDVQFEGAFAFVQALESYLSNLLGDNFVVKLSPQQIDINYLIQIPYIGTPAFGFKDVSFRILYTLYFNKKPMEIGFGVGMPENKVKLSVGIYTGLFYFLVVANPKQGITAIEVCIEFGGYFGLSLGPLRGEVKLVVGLYYRKDESGVIIEGYFLCEGSVKLWFVIVAARFYMGVRSQGSYVEGRCTVSYEISIGFFKKSFSATYYKKVAGASPANGQSNGLAKDYSKQQQIQQKNNKVIAKINNGVNTSITADTLQKFGNDTKEYNSNDTAYTHPIERKVKPLKQSKWNDFINSYKN